MDFSVSGADELDALSAWFACQVRHEAQARLVAVDSAGRVHEPADEPAMFLPAMLGHIVMTSVRFPGLKSSELKELRIQVRPYHWIEFRNIALHPGQRTRVEVVEYSGGS